MNDHNCNNGDCWLKYDPSSNRPNKDREKQVSKSIAGFMNTQ